MKAFFPFLIVIFVSLTTSVYAEGSKGVNFARADSDKNKILNRDEFRNFINLLAESGHKNAKRVRTFRLYSLAWAHVDANGDGYASQSELSLTNQMFKNRNKKVKVTYRR